MPSNPDVKRPTDVELNWPVGGHMTTQRMPGMAPWILACHYVRDIKAARFAPLGDNHHNAAECPYCNPKHQEQAATIAALKTENHRLDMDAETFKARMDEQEIENRRLHASIELLDTLPDAHKIAEQAAESKRLRGLLRRERYEVLHDFGCDCDLCVAVDAALKEGK